ncbi:PrgI family protein [Candidatus Saccharibacteria bacterium]|nr:PrgI family protein [Candidatus Saccharibacteria bacterium]
MAQYKVPQDVEADDKLLGPFSFRQFVYLLIAGFLIAIAVGLFQIFPLLAFIPLPPILLFAALALPLKKDQPMETYLAAVASYYLKPRNRIWTPGQRESTIKITAPKIVEESRKRDITGEEATHRLSFLADIVDTEGYAIKGGVNHASAELAAEAAGAPDMFEANSFGDLTSAIAQDENEHHAEVIEQMKEEIARTENIAISGGIIKRGEDEEKVKEETASATVVEKPVENSSENISESVEKAETKPANPSIIELANNDDYSVATIAKEANRIKERDAGEVFVSLH